MKERGETIVKNSVIFIIYDGKEIQLERRKEKNDPYYGYVLIPGGKVEQGEAPQNALIREIREEYGAKYIKAEELGAIESYKEDGQINYRHVFLVNGWKGRLLNPEHRNTHFRATIDEAKQLCKHPISQKVLNLLETKLLGQDC
jgi:8-oxo-dGTP diphosphatase